MKVQGEMNKLEMSGMTNTAHTFTIQATAKAFKILSDGLYSDKILAVIRELSCNAYDAHVAVGTDTPFEVHLPNSFEPFFRVADFGPGMSEEQIYDLYTSYFQSTKCASNDYIGALGLGSKSPFSYTDSFTVTSYHGGAKKVYSAYLTEEGMPTIVKMGEDLHASDQTGLEVQFPVKQGDFYEFASKAVTALRYFPVLPRITGKTINLERPTYSLSGDGWFVRHEEGRSRAIQGAVSYAIPSLSSHPQLNHLIESMGIDLVFPIGDLEVAASRETLSMNKTTTANIVAKLEKVKLALLESVKAEIEGAPSFWAACTLLCKFRRRGNPLHMLVRQASFKWQEREVSEVIEGKTDEFPAMVFTSLNIRGYRRTISEDSYYYNSAFSISPGQTMVIRDLDTRGSKSVLRQYFKDTKLCPEVPENIFIFRRRNSMGADGKTPMYSQEMFERDATAFLERVGGATITDASDIRAKLPKKEKIKGTKVDRAVFTVLKPGYNAWGDAWTPASDADLDADTKYYIPVSRNKPLSANDSYSGDLIQVVAALKRCCFMDSDAPLFAGSSPMLKAIAKDEDSAETWVPIDTLVAEFYDSATPELLEKFASDLTFYNLGLPDVKKPITELPGLAQYSNHAFITFYESVAAKIQAAETYKVIREDYYTINRFFGQKSFSVNILDNYSRQMEKFRTSYPLLTFNTWQANPSEILRMVRYMAAMDLLEEFEQETATAVV